MARIIRKDPLEGIIQAVGALFVGAFIFIPHSGWYLAIGVGLLLVGVVCFIAVKLARNREAHLCSFEPSIVADEPGTFRVELPAVVAPKPMPHAKPEPSLSQRLRTIDWFQFEKLVAAAYASKNYTVSRVGGANADGGVDLMVENPATKFVVQCKQWKSWKVGVRHIREFLGTLTDSGVRKGVFITLQGYTDEARELAAKHGIELMNEAKLMMLLEQANWKYNPTILAALDDTAKHCPKCESKMVLRTATKGKNAGGHFWGCLRYPRCRFVLTA